MSLLKHRRVLFPALAGLSLAGAQLLSGASVFTQANLTSDVPGLAANTDQNLKNPWGVSFGGASPFWVSNQVSGNSTLYNGAGVPQTLIVSTPPASPTGQAFVGGTGQFVAPNGKPALFTFATLAGTIDAWNGSNGTTASVVATTSGAVYTGLTLANNGSGNFLYAANALGGINVFDSSFKPVTLAGSFVDPNLPKGYTPYNVQAVGGNLFVTYAQGRNTGLGLGIVSEFDANGNFVKRLISGGQLDAPWGITLAPSGFGKFGGDLLVGNFGNGEINAFNPSNGSYLGTLANAQGNPFVNDSLWSLSFRTASGFNPDSLYFTAGINGEKDGLFGSITPTPEPATFAVAGLGLLALVALKRARV